MSTEHALKEVNALMNKFGFDEDERSFVVNIADNSPLLPTVVMGLATIKFTRSVAMWTKVLAVFTGFLIASTVIQVYIAFHCH
jgi:hypothetical protein